MYKCLKANKYEDFSESEWKKYYDLRLLLEESFDRQTAFKSFTKLKESIPNSFNGTNQLIVIDDGQKFVARFWLTRVEKQDYNNARLDFTFDSILYNIPSEIVSLIRACILEFKQDNEPVYYQASSFKFTGLVNSMNGKLADEDLSFKLNTEDIDWNNINEWYKKGRDKNPDFKLKLYKGLPKNKERKQELLDLWKLVDMDLPNEENYYDFFSNRDYTTEGCEYIDKNGGVDYFLTLIDAKSNKMIGLTHVCLYSPKPGLASQGISGVMPEYRNLGLGKYLKAAMIKKLIKDFPERFKGLWSDISRENHAILKITKLMGFKYQGSNLRFWLDI